MHEYDHYPEDEQIEDDDLTVDLIREESEFFKYSWNEKHHGFVVENGKPAIQVTEGSLPETIKSIDDALKDPKHGVFQRNGQLVRLGKISGKGDLAFILFGPEDLQVYLSKIISWGRWDGRKNMVVRVDCPLGIARNYLALKGGWAVPHIHTIVSAPTMRPDGSILDQLGLDIGTGIYLDTRGVEFPKVPDRPTK
jgi:hypothetical protein